MKNWNRGLVVASTLVIVCFIVILKGITEERAENKTLRKQMSNQESSGLGGKPQSFSNHRSTPDGRDLGGFTQQPGLSIHWSGSDPTDDDVGPIDVIEATLNRLTAEQQTNLGSDRKARAMFSLLEAIDYLSGTSEVTGKPLGSKEE